MSFNKVIQKSSAYSCHYAVQPQSRRPFVVWVPFLSPSLFNLSSSTLSFMQENRGLFIFWMISLIPMQDFFSVFAQFLNQEKKGRECRGLLPNRVCSLLLFGSVPCNFTPIYPWDEYNKQCQTTVKKLEGIRPLGSWEEAVHVFYLKGEIREGTY